MVYFYAWETVDITITLDRENALVDCDDVVVSIGQIGSRVLHKSDELDIDENSNTIIMHLEQRETGKFVEGEANVQVNLYYSNGERDTSSKAVIYVRDNLYREAMS